MVTSGGVRSWRSGWVLGSYPCCSRSPFRRWPLVVPPFAARRSSFRRSPLAAGRWPRKSPPIARAHPESMADDIQVGRMVRDVRLARNLRQVDVAVRAGVTRQLVSRLERGLVEGMPVGSLRAISRALGMPSILSLGWRTPEIDRLRDRVHAAMVESVASMLSSLRWELAPEHSFNHYGERGSADILAWHDPSRTLLIIETKSRIWDLQETLFALDRKRRVLPGLVARERGWRIGAVGVLLVLPEMSTHRHVVARHSATFRAALPHRQIEVRDWLAAPVGDLRGLCFLPISHQKNIGQRSRRRVGSKRRRSAPRGPDGFPQGPDEAGHGNSAAASEPSRPDSGPMAR